MIVASDLDRTIMYSTRALEELGMPENIELIPVERNAESILGYMTKKAFNQLQLLNNNSLFIPITTRTTEQFNRFIIFDKDIPLTYAVTTNGASILYKGEPLTEWTEQLKDTMNKESAKKEEILAIFERERIRFNGVRKDVKQLFFYYILNSLPSKEELTFIRDHCARLGWKTSLQGRKLYLIPYSISKGNALRFICQREGMDALAGAGDSLLDWDFLKHCQYRYVPNHGELKSETSRADFTATHHQGILAGEEILHYFVELLTLHR